MPFTRRCLRLRGLSTSTLKRGSQGSAQRGPTSRSIPNPTAALQPATAAHVARTLPRPSRSLARFSDGRHFALPVLLQHCRRGRGHHKSGQRGQLPVLVGGIHRAACTDIANVVCSVACAAPPPTRMAAQPGPRAGPPERLWPPPVSCAHTRFPGFSDSSPSPRADPAGPSAPPDPPLLRLRMTSGYFSPVENTKDAGADLMPPGFTAAPW
jgi:hypothetical protein